jgi:chromosome segregation ATPase
VKTADSAGSDLGKLQDQFERSRAQIAAVMTALNELTAEGADTKKELGKFTKAVESLRKTTGNDSATESRAEASVNAYFETWGAEIAAMSNQDLKEQSTKRRHEVMANFEAVKQAFNETTKAYEPFLKELDDLVRYLSADLSAAGIESAGNMISGLKTQGVEVQRAIQNAAEKLQALRTSMGR